MQGSGHVGEESEAGLRQHHVPALPPEVIALVFDRLGEEVHPAPTDPAQEVSTDTVKAILSAGYSCCLVSHAFLPHGRNLLYSHLGLGHLESSARQLEVVLKTPHLAALVQVWEMNFAEDWDFAEIAQLLPRTHTIVYNSRHSNQNLEGSTRLHAHITRLALPPAALGNRLRCLHLAMSDDHTTDAICAAITAYPNLESLSIFMAMSPFFAGVTFALAHLRHLDVSWCNKHLVTALLIASPALETLRIRYTDSASPSDGIERFPASSSLRDIGIRGLVVHRVRFTSPDSALAQEYAEEDQRLFSFIASFSSLTSLEILETSYASPEHPQPPAIETCHDLLGTLPKSLEALHISGKYIDAIGLSLSSIRIWMQPPWVGLGRLSGARGGGAGDF